MKQISSVNPSIVSTRGVTAQRSELLLDKNWKFTRGDTPESFSVGFDDSGWDNVVVPHDWAIYGPFDKEIDIQEIAITQNNEAVATEKTGRTGSLPHIGVGWYRNVFELPDLVEGKKALLVFDGAMSQAQVYVNGRKVGARPYGYSYFYFDITSFIKRGEKNVLAVRLENDAQSSRWYPGAGLYRDVRVIVKSATSFDHWGTSITTPYITDEVAKVNVKNRVSGSGVRVVTEITDGAGQLVVSGESGEFFGDEIEQNLAVPTPHRWSPETPYLYTATSKLYQGADLQDQVVTRFGIREIKYDATNGFQLNGETRKFKGVCLHHDLGPIGAAVNKAAIRRQLVMMKDLGCNAVRSSHNMPSFEQLELCDELGLMFLAESFDEWAVSKVKNGYHKYFEAWAEKDLVDLVHATRNHPCIVMWSSGNEVPDQCGSAGVKRAKWLQDIFHREDPTRPVTVGMDQVQAVMESGFGALLDVPGLNYRVHLYEEAYQKFPQGFILGSETASTVSSRGVYKFPVEAGAMKTYADYQCSSYDLEVCSWSNRPDDDFEFQDDKPWVIGEFVWTGFDYLGEPTPYDECWPSRSSYFGICDLAGLPKDRYYLYRSRWNTNDDTLHILPHWTWPGREGETTPVFVYTNYDSAELFVNGVSQGIQKKSRESKQHRYRLMWMDVKYEPGTIKVVALDSAGAAVAEQEVHTAGQPHHVELCADRAVIDADGKDLSFVTVSVVDAAGNLCADATHSLGFNVSGAGRYRAACNGDATSLELFHEPRMQAFSGKLVVLVQSSEESGSIVLEVTGEGLEAGTIEIASR